MTIEQAPTAASVPPPVAEVRPVVRSHHGDDVVDGYEWLRAKDDEAVLAAAARDLVATSRTRRLETMTIEQVGGVFVYGTPVGRALRDAGFVESPKGLTLRRTTAGDAARAVRHA